jgi:hypothetical protein
MPKNDNYSTKITPSAVAEWILSSVQEQGELSQNNAFYEIIKRFGSITNGGSPSVGRSVLTAFRKISDDIVLWEQGDKKWRKREFYDAPGRQQH